MNIESIKKYFVNFYEGFKHDEQKRNRVLILFLVFIGLCSVVLGLSSTRQTIKKPFIDKEKDAITSIYDTYNQLKSEGKIKDDVTATTNTTAANSKAYSDAAAKNTDTDGDGISDYDEVNIFKTSAFLKDSDGDGISDYDEIKAGTDPNCPTGKDCSTTTATNAAKDNAGTNFNAVDASKMDIKQARIELEKIIPESLKPMLANMTDDQVRSLMSQLYAGATAANTTTTNSNSTTTNVNVVTDFKIVL